MKKTKDSSCSLPLHFWSIFRSPFSTFYIPFQISGSQESASNRVRFGAEMRKIWPSEDNCSRLVRNSHNTFRLCEPCAKLAQHLQLCEPCAKLAQHSHNTLVVRSLCETRTTLAQHLQNSHSPCVVRILLCFCRLHFRYFPLYFFDVISFLILVTNQSQALLL